MSWFYGFGPTIGYHKYSIDRTREYPYEEDSTGWKTGITGVIGAEWFVTQQISLLGEYGVETGYRSRKCEMEDDLAPWYNYEETEKGFFLESRPVKFGVSVYF